MRNPIYTTLFILAAIVFISCDQAQNNDPMALWNELNQNAQPNSLTEEEANKDWQLLFDGESFDGWRGYNMNEAPDSWIVEDRALTMTTVGGHESQDVITDKTYRNFAFNFEYKITPGANSGIIFQIKEDPKYQFPYETGPEFQIIDDEGWPGQLEDWQVSGANYAMHPPLAKAYKPVGEWNRGMIVVNGNQVTYILNGHVTATYEKYSDEWNELRNSGKWSDFPDYGKYDQGHISLQNHGTKVWFRNLKIKTL